MRRTAMTLGLIMLAAAAAEAALEAGQPAPTILLADQTGTLRDVASDSYGRYVALVFYPADDTPGCTRENVSVSEAYDALQDADIDVYGVSVQDADSKQAFCAKYDLRHPLLADVDKRLSEAFGVLSDRGYSNRVTFLIDPAGVVRSVNESVALDDHGQEILRTVETLRTEDAEGALGVLSDERVALSDGYTMHVPAGWSVAERGFDRLVLSGPAGATLEVMTQSPFPAEVTLDQVRAMLPTPEPIALTELRVNGHRAITGAVRAGTNAHVGVLFPGRETGPAGFILNVPQAHLMAARRLLPQMVRSLEAAPEA